MDEVADRLKQMVSLTVHSNLKLIDRLAILILISNVAVLTQSSWSSWLFCGRLVWFGHRTLSLLAKSKGRRSEERSKEERGERRSIEWKCCMKTQCKMTVFQIGNSVLSEACVP